MTGRFETLVAENSRIEMSSRQELENLDREWVAEKQRHGNLAGLRLRSVAGWVGMLVGVAMVLFGRSLWDGGMDAWRDAPGGWFMFIGACLAIGSLVFTIVSNRPLRAYNEAKCRYDVQREKLLEDIYRDDHHLDSPRDELRS